MGIKEYHLHTQSLMLISLYQSITWISLTLSDPLYYT